MNTQQLTIMSKEPLADQTYIVRLQMQHTARWAPGQFVVLQVGPKVFRSYSLVDIGVDIASGEEGKGPVMTLLLDTHVGGPASKFFEEAKVGDTLNLVGAPLGKLSLRENGRPKVFIATGTGLAPFVPMIKQALSDPAVEVSLFFGVRNVADAYAETFFPELEKAVFADRFKLYTCISRPEGELPKGCLAGRVTAVVPEKVSDYEGADFYLCGNPAMIDEMTDILLKNGGQMLPGGKGNIHAERY